MNKYYCIFSVSELETVLAEAKEAAKDSKGQSHIKAGKNIGCVSLNFFHAPGHRDPATNSEQLRFNNIE